MSSSCSRARRPTSFGDRTLSIVPITSDEDLAANDGTRLLIYSTSQEHEVAVDHGVRTEIGPASEDYDVAHHAATRVAFRPTATPAREDETGA